MAWLRKLLPFLILLTMAGTILTVCGYVPLSDSIKIKDDGSCVRVSSNAKISFESRRTRYGMDAVAHTDVDVPEERGLVLKYSISPFGAVADNGPELFAEAHLKLPDACFIPSGVPGLKEKIQRSELGCDATGDGTHLVMDDPISPPVSIYCSSVEAGNCMMRTFHSGWSWDVWFSRHQINRWQLVHKDSMTKLDQSVSRCDH